MAKEFPDGFEPIQFEEEQVSLEAPEQDALDAFEPIEFDEEQFEPVDFTKYNGGDIISAPGDGSNFIEKSIAVYGGTKDWIKKHMSEQVKGIARGPMVIGKGIANLTKIIGQNIQVPDKDIELLKSIGYDENSLKIVEANNKNNLGRVLENWGTEAADYWTWIQETEPFKRDEEIFKGSFMENPSFTRLAAGVCESYAQIGAACVATVASGGSSLAGGMFLGAFEGADVYNEAEKAGLPLWKRNVNFAAATVGLGVLESALPAGLTRGFAKTRIGNIIAGAITEGVTEGAQTFWQNLVVKYGIDDTQDLFEGAWEASFVGALSGGNMSAFGKLSKARTENAIERMRKKGMTTEEILMAHETATEALIAKKDDVQLEMTKIEDEAKVFTEEQQRQAEEMAAEQEFTDINVPQEITDEVIADEVEGVARDILGDEVVDGAIEVIDAIEQEALPVEEQAIKEARPLVERAAKQIEKMEKRIDDGEIASLTQLAEEKTDLISQLNRSRLIPTAQRKAIVSQIGRARSVPKFNNLLKSVKEQILSVQKRREVRQKIKQKSFKKVENFRRSLGLPSLKKMNLKQLEEYDTELSKFEEGDVFLTQGQLKHVDKTDLKGIKTLREAREKLAKETGVPIEELSKIKVSEFDRFKYDTALARQNPFYKVLVEETHRGLIEAEAEAFQKEEKINELTKKARESRKRSFIDKLVPSDELVFDYLEASKEDKAELENKMTPEELELALYLQNEFAEALEYLIKTESLKTGRENYITNVRRDFFEVFKEDGLVKAFKEMFNQYKLDEQVFDILDQDTGNILPLEKFFQFSMQRTGNITPTKNVAKAASIYFRTLEKKKALDALIPKMTIYTDALTPQLLTPNGLQMDRSIKKFVFEWLNTKKGRKRGLFIKPGGKIDVGVGLVNSVVTMLDLGLSVPVGLAANVGETVATMTRIGAKNVAKGIARMNTEKGKRVIKKYESFVGKSIFGEMSEASKSLGDKFYSVMFGLFHESTQRTNKIELLSSMTDEEYKNETISSKRLSEIKVAMGRFRAISDFKSVFGATTEGGLVTKYKSWAIPIFSSVANDLGNIAKNIKAGKKGVSTSKEAKELFNALTITAAALAFGSMVDEEDRSFVGQLLNKMRRESLTIIGALDPRLFTGEPRLLAFATDLSNALVQIVMLEKYKQGQKKGKLKGVAALARTLTPKGTKVFIPEKQKSGIVQR